MSEIDDAMKHDHRYPAVSEQDWALLAPLLPGTEGSWGRKAQDNRLFVNAVLWVLHTGAPWRELPAEYGDWKNTHRRFCRWRDKGVWELLLEQLIEIHGYEWLLLGPEDYGGPRRARARRYRWPWLRLICRSEKLLKMLPAEILSRLAVDLGDFK